MSSSKAALRSQRRRELDARRSKSRIRLGSSLQGWAQLKDKLGFSLHSQLAQHLLESYVSRVCIKCSGHEKGEISTTMESLQELIMLVHSHGQTCPLPPVLRSGSERDQSAHETAKRAAEIDSSELDVCFKYTCEDRHHFLWSPIKRMKVMTSKKGDTTASSSKKLKQRGRRLTGEPITHIEKPEMVTRLKTRRQHRENADVNTEETEQKKEMRSEMFRENKNAGVKVTETSKTQEGSYVAAETSLSESLADSEEMTGDDPDRVCTENRSPPDSNEEVAVLNLTNRGTQNTADPIEKRNNSKKTGVLKNNSLQSFKNDVSEIGGKRKRKSTSKVILPCEFEGCDKIFSSRQYLNHHVKYQHVQQKTFSCSHPSCNKSFNFKKHLKEHEKLHSNQRDYICEFCARAFRTSSNLIIHRRIHTGEKPLQCEVCGFTCRQKASLNWHMRKHNAESTYQFPCEICGRRFEKRDNVTAHRSKSHPDYNTPTADLALPLPPSDPLLHPSGQRGSFPSASRNQTAAE